MKRMVLAAMLAGCAVPEPAARIEVDSGNWMGGTRTVIYQTGLVVQEITEDQRVNRTEKQMSPTVFVSAAAVIAGEGTAVRAAFKPEDPVALDYGHDLVRAVPPIGAFDEVVTMTPDRAVTMLMKHVLAALKKK